MKAYIVSIGDELLIGQVVDTNSTWLGKKLGEVGVEVVGKCAVGDSKSDIIEAFQYGHSKADLVIVTGGLGPTKDDITKVAIAEYYNVDLVFSDETYKRIVTFFEKINKPISESHKVQCYMPSNVRLLKNKMGTAPGMWFEKEGKTLLSMPGVPFEMYSIMDEVVLPTLLSTDQSIYHKTLMTSGLGETEIEDAITKHVVSFPDYIKMAYLPSLGVVRLRLSGKHNDALQLKHNVDMFSDQIKMSLGNVVFADEDISLEQYMLQIFTKHAITLGTAESCTGGYLSHRLTTIPSSSSYYTGSIISYSNDIKTSLLNVNPKTLHDYGAVSEQTVVEMVQGALKSLKTDVAVAISGIAGPDGGTEEKPVGTIWIAVGNKEKIETKLIRGTKNRVKNIEYATNLAMNIIRLFVEENYGDR